MIEAEEYFVRYKSERMLASLSVPALGLTIKSNRTEIEKCTSEESEVKNETTEPKFNYDQHGADWPDLFPACGNEQQSPINLLSPITKYG